MIERNKETINTRFGWKVDIDEHAEIAAELGADERAWLDSRKIMTFEQMVKNKPWEVANANEPLSENTGGIKHTQSNPDPSKCP